MGLSEEQVKAIIEGKFDLNRTWSIGFQYWRDYEKEPLTKEEFDQIQNELLEVFKKHNMSWKVL